MEGSSPPQRRRAPGIFFFHGERETFGGGRRPLLRGSEGQPAVTHTELVAFVLNGRASDDYVPFNCGAGNIPDGEEEKPKIEGGKGP